MNNDDSPRWNIEPEARGGADGGKWNRNLVAGVTLFGVTTAAYWLWTRVSQRKTKEVQENHKEDVVTLTKDMNIKISHLQQELNKERQQVQHYKKTLDIQTQVVNQLQKKCGELKQQRKHISTTMVKAMNEGEQFQQKSQVILQELEAELKNKQDDLCNRGVVHLNRFGQQHLIFGLYGDLERKLMNKFDNDPIAAELGLKEGIKDIIHNDFHCMNQGNPNDRRNGKLIWLYLRQWQQQVNLKKQTIIVEALKRCLSNDK